MSYWSVNLRSFSFVLFWYFILQSIVSRKAQPTVAFRGFLLLCPPHLLWWNCGRISLNTFVLSCQHKHVLWRVPFIVWHWVCLCQMFRPPRRRPPPQVRPRDPTASCSAPPPAPTSNQQVHTNTTHMLYTFLQRCGDIPTLWLVSLCVSVHSGGVWQERVSNHAAFS